MADGEDRTGGVTAQDVTASIEMILGFTPDAALVDYHLGLGFPDRFALGKYMMSTDMFRQNHGWRTSHPIFLGDRVYAHTHRGERIFLVPTDVDLTPTLVDGRPFEPHIEQAVTNAVRAGDTVVDAGCNIGYHTLVMAKAVGPEGKLFGFEANPEVYRLLHATFMVNHFTDFRAMGRAELFNEAVADRDGFLTLAVAPNNFGSGNLVTDDPMSDFGAEYTKRVQVKTVTLDEKLAHVPKIDFLHMDIEGAEPLALQGARELLARSPEIIIVTEWSNHMMRALADLPAHIAWLGAQGFRFWRIVENGWLRPVEQENLIHLPHCDIFMSRIDPPTTYTVVSA
jgi:FkbM family methyltransferase